MLHTHSVSARWFSLLVAAAFVALFADRTALAGNYSPGGLGTADLNYWLDANYGVETTTGVAAVPTQTVQVWKDRLGVNNGVQNTASSRPTYQTGGPNSTNTLFFQGLGGSNVNNDWVSTSVSTTTNNFSVFSVAQRNGTHQVEAQATSGTGGTSGQYYLFGPTNKNTEGGSGLSVGTNGISAYEHGAGYMPSLATWDASPSGVGNGYNIIAYEYTAKQPRIYMNGLLRQTGLTSPKANVYSPFEVGGNSNYGGLDGHVSEAFVYKRTLNTTEKVIVNNYLSSKYDLALVGIDKYQGDTVLNGNNDRDVFGVGRTGISDAVVNAGSAGLSILNAVVDNGEYLLAGHNQATNSIIEENLIRRWSRVWYLDNNSGTISADLEFDFSDSDLAAVLPAGAQMQLLYATNSSLDWQVLGDATNVGDKFTFSLSNIATGYYTLGVLIAPEPGSAMLLASGFLMLVKVRRRKQRGAGRG